MVYIYIVTLSVNEEHVLTSRSITQFIEFHSPVIMWTCFDCVCGGVWGCLFVLFRALVPSDTVVSSSFQWYTTNTWSVAQTIPVQVGENHNRVGIIKILPTGLQVKHPVLLIHETIFWYVFISYH